MIRDAYSIALDPLLPWWLIAGLVFAFLLLVGYALLRRARGAFLRLLAGMALTAILLNPSLVEEQRAYQLAAAGVGRLTVADADKVDLMNLQRQILHRTDSVGRPKVESARAALHALNPEVAVVPLQRRVEDFSDLAADADVVLDCSDNFATRKAINRACVMRRTPLVSGAAIRFDAQLMVFDLSSPASPCYACLFPEDGEVEEVQCSTMGVFAPLTGVIGAMQAMEAIKLLTGVGETLSGKLVLLDAKTAEWRTVSVKKDPACGVCGQPSR